jgi:lantibiotic modifying enzyme
MMAGAPGALLVAQFLWEMNEDKSLPEKIRWLAESLLEKWVIDDKTGLPIWIQNYGSGPTTFLGAAHGAVGNIFTLLRVAAHLTKAQNQSILENCLRLLKTTAVQNNSEANWPPRLGVPDQNLLVHWCHGSPGILMQLASTMPKELDDEFEELLIKAGTLIWNAGGLKKGASLCHGTAGSGAALLKLYTRTGDDLWLRRGREMAMTTLRQIKEDKIKYGHLRYSLWTGDIGSVLFLNACIEGSFDTPMMDVI